MSSGLLSDFVNIWPPIKKLAHKLVELDRLALAGYHAHSYLDADRLSLQRDNLLWHYVTGLRVEKAGVSG
jgi:hypothetical protein